MPIQVAVGSSPLGQTKHTYSIPTPPPPTPLPSCRDPSSHTKDQLSPNSSHHIIIIIIPSPNATVLLYHTLPHGHEFKQTTVNLPETEFCNCKITDRTHQRITPLQPSPHSTSLKAITDTIAPAPTQLDILHAMPTVPCTSPHHTEHIL